jgi:hypothetical protein
MRQINVYLNIWIYRILFFSKNRVLQKYDNVYLRRRACIESARGSWFQVEFWVFFYFELFFVLFLDLPLFVPFIGLVIFPSSRWHFWAFLGFVGPLAVHHGVLDSNFKLCAFCCQWTHQGGDWEIKWSVSWFDCDESLTCRGLNLNLGCFGSFTFTFVSFKESCLLVSWYAGDRCGMVGGDEDSGWNRRPGAEDRGWSYRSGTRWSDDQAVGWRCVRSAPCMRRRGAQISWLSLKTKVGGLSVFWPQNHCDGLSVVWPQNH